MAKGGRKPRVSDEEILDVFRNTTKPELTATDVAEELPIKRRAVLNRLGDLEEEGELGKRTVGGTSVIWWLPEVRLAIERLRERGELLNRAEDSPPQPPDSSTEEPPAEPPTEPKTGEADAILDGWPPRATDKREARRKAGAEAIEYLRKVGEAKAGDFKQNVEPKAPVEGQSTDTWWKKTGRPAINRAKEAGYVDYHNGTKIYTWTGN